MTVPRDTQCPLCDHTARLLGFVGHNPLNWQMQCETCGFFIIGEPTARHLNDPDNGLKSRRYLLSHLTRKASGRQAQAVQIYQDRLEPLLSSVNPPATPDELVDNILLEVGTQTDGFFGKVNVNCDRDYPKVFARSGQEYAYAISIAHQGGLLSTMASGPTFSISPAGWRRITELRKVSSLPDQAFVAMWFDPQMDPAWSTGFKPALEELGYRPMRIDKEHFQNRIDDEIEAQIRRSGLVIADFTDNRGGVYYEAGLGRGLGIAVILTCRKDHFDKVHFDTNHYPYVVWETPQDLKSGLADRLDALGLRRLQV